MHYLNNFIKGTTLYSSLRNWGKARRQKKKLIEWERNGRPSPPPHIVKQQTIKNYAKKFGLNILIETGTYYGDMIQAMRRDFNKIYSIELSEELYKKAKTRFNGVKNVELIHGDSGIELGNLVKRIDQPALFWLDGHYSAGITAKGEKDTPIYEELNHIFSTQIGGHVIIIDDARCFGTDPAYPSIEELNHFVKSKNPDINIEIKDDSIRITPNSKTH